MLVLKNGNKVSCKLLLRNKALIINIGQSYTMKKNLIIFILTIYLVQHSFAQDTADRNKQLQKNGLPASVS